jgi:hypothetical protein
VLSIRQQRPPAAARCAAAPITPPFPRRRRCGQHIKAVGGGSPGTSQFTDQLAALVGRGGAAAAASILAAVLTEIYLCGVCSCHEMLRRNGRGQGRGRWAM